MTISIKAKVPCNSISFLTNKGGKQELINIDKKKIALEYNNIGVLVLKPVIDRLDFSFNPTQDFLNTYDPAADLAEYKKAVKDSAHQDAATGSDGLSLLTDASFYKPPFSQYNSNLVYQPPGKSERVTIHIGPKKPGHPFMRFSMKPSRITPEGMKAFRRMVAETLLMTGASPIDYVDFLERCKVIRMEAAVDILGLRPYDMKITPVINGKAAEKKGHVYKSKTGRTETVYPDTKPEKSDIKYVYDKRQALIDEGQEPHYGDFLHSRYECRVQKTTFPAIKKLNNRAGRVAIEALDIGKFWKLNHSHRLFMRVALDRTLDKALDLIPEKLHPAYKKAYQASFHKIWKPKEIWKFWGEAWKASGIFHTE